MLWHRRSFHHPYRSLKRISGCLSGFCWFLLRTAQAGSGPACFLRLAQGHSWRCRIYGKGCSSMGEGDSVCSQISHSVWCCSSYGSWLRNQRRGGLRKDRAFWVWSFFLRYVIDFHNNPFEEADSSALNCSSYLYDLGEVSILDYLQESGRMTLLRGGQDY